MGQSKKQRRMAQKLHEGMAGALARANTDTTPNPVSTSENGHSLADADEAYHNPSDGHHTKRKRRSTHFVSNGHEPGTWSERPSNLDHDDDGQAWQTVQRKRRKISPAQAADDRIQQHDAPLERGDSRPKYPETFFSSSVSLQRHVKLKEVQDLILYVLADGSAPKWLSFKNAMCTQTVVVVMVPGLERDMFDGSIPLVDLEAPTEERVAAIIGHVNSRNQHNALAEPNPSVAEAGTLAVADPNPFETVQDLDAERKRIVEIGNGVSNDGANSAHAPKAQPDYKLSTSDEQKLASKVDRDFTIAKTPDDYYPWPLKTLPLPAALEPLADIFEHVWEWKAPGDYKLSQLHSPLGAILQTPKQKSPDNDRKAREGSSGFGSVPMTELVTSADELLYEDYTVHPWNFDTDEERDANAAARLKAGTTVEHDGWVDTPDPTNLPDPRSSTEASEAIRFLALDCEMCITIPNPKTQELTRISVVDANRETVYDTYVKPTNEITDYVTQFSGITPEIMAKTTTTLADVQKILIEKFITPTTILIGHSLVSDMNALKMTHPHIVDTALLYPHPKGPPMKSALKYLTNKYLNRIIQNAGQQGHDSSQDALAALDLATLKSERGKDYATFESNQESIFDRLRKTHQHRFDISRGPENTSYGAMADYGNLKHGMGSPADIRAGCDNDDDIVESIRRLTNGINGLPPAAGLVSPDQDMIGVPTKSISNGSNDAVKATREPVETPTSTIAPRDDTIRFFGALPSQPIPFTFARLRHLEFVRGKQKTNGGPQPPPLPAGADPASNPNILPDDSPDAANRKLSHAVSVTTQNIKKIYDSLPSCSLLIVYSGTGDTSEMARLNRKKYNFRGLFQTKKWDEIDEQDRWLDGDQTALRAATDRARYGVGFVGVK